jgi:hypothetical protein
MVKAKKEPARKCAGCGAGILIPMVAMSRYDNTTLLCSECGAYEAMVQWNAYRTGKDPRKALASPGRAVIVEGDGG